MPAKRRVADQEDGAFGNLFDLAEVAVYILVERPQVEDPVADELPRPVPRDIPAAVGFDRKHRVALAVLLTHHGDEEGANRPALLDQVAAL